MRLEKLEPVEPKFRSTFTCEIDTMMGDADDFKTIEIPLQGYAAPLLEQVLKTIRAGYNDEKFHDIPNAGRFFVLEGDNRYHKLVLWPYNYDCGCYYGYESHAYYWYDSTGRKFHAGLTTPILSRSNNS